MSGWTKHNGMAVALAVDNVDTDQLIPARFMSRPRKDGYGDLLLHDFRKTAIGSENADFILNRFPEASVLLAGRNFGSGSSREAAVYALVDAGIQAVFATSFGDIFTSNAINNGLLPACVSDADYAQLRSLIGTTVQPVCVDLTMREISVGEVAVAFRLDDALHTKLVNGWDDIDLTLDHSEKIASYRENRKQRLPWSCPATVI
ncbi:MAG: 3-isopropylmalate dehydratase small subunit [Granulosicoccus sp.]